MKVRSILFSGALALVGVFAAGRVEAQGIVLEISGVPGESTVSGYVGQIDVGSVQWGVGSPGCGGPISVSEITMTKSVDKASIPFQTALRDHTGYATATFRWLRSDGQVYQKYILSNATITGYSSSSGGDRPSESVSFGFSQVAVSYTYFDGSGKAGATQTVTITNTSCP